MSEVVHEEKFLFPIGRVYLLMDADLGIEICGENGIDGELVDMASWEFDSEENWQQWGEYCTERINQIRLDFLEDKITEEECTKMIHLLTDEDPTGAIKS